MGQRPVSKVWSQGVLGPNLGGGKELKGAGWLWKLLAGTGAIWGEKGLTYVNGERGRISEGIKTRPVKRSCAERGMYGRK